ARIDERVGQRDLEQLTRWIRRRLRWRARGDHQWHEQRPPHAERVASRNAARARICVEGSVGSTESASEMISGISVHPSTTASHPRAASSRIAPEKEAGARAEKTPHPRSLKMS